MQTLPRKKRRRPRRCLELGWGLRLPIPVTSYPGRTKGGSLLNVAHQPFSSRGGKVTPSMYVVCSAHICQGLRGWAEAVGGILEAQGRRRKEAETSRERVCVSFFRTPGVTEKPNTPYLLWKNQSYRMMLLSSAGPPLASLCLILDQRADINTNVQTQTRETYSYRPAYYIRCC